MSNADSSSTLGKVAEAQREQRKNSSKPLLGGGQGRKASMARKGKLKKPSRKTKQVTANAPSGKSQKKRLIEERQRWRAAVQLRQEPKQTSANPKEPVSVEAIVRLTSRLAKGLGSPPMIEATHKVRTPVAD